MEERPPQAVMDPPAAIWLRVGGIWELRRRPPPPAIRQPAAEAGPVMCVRTAPPLATPAAAMEEHPPTAVMDPPAVVWIRLGGLGESRRRPPPPAVRRQAAAGRRAMWARTAPLLAAPAAAMEERPPSAVMHPPAVVWFRLGGLGELRRRPPPPAVRRPTAAPGRRYLEVCPALPPETAAESMRERPPPAVMHSLAVDWRPLGGLGEFRLQRAPPAVRRPPAAAPMRGDRASERAGAEVSIPQLPPRVRSLAAAERRALSVCMAPPAAMPAVEMEEQPPPAVVDPLAAALQPVGRLGELRRLPLPPAAFRRPAVVLRECRTMGTAFWGAVIPPPPLRPPLRP